MYRTIVYLPMFVLAILLVGHPLSSQAQTTNFNGVNVPGVVITHSPASSGVYTGTPSLAILPNGDYIASTDYFGPNADQIGIYETDIFRSTDRGQTWSAVTTIDHQYWSNLFVYNNDLYLLGVPGGRQEMTIRKSIDGGSTWTEPTSSTNGILRSAGSLGFHTSSVPVVVHNGRIWRAYEDNATGGPWPGQFRAAMMSAPIGSDLLNAANWTHTNAIASDSSWLANGFNGWLEGNAVIDRNGNIVNITRVDVGVGEPEKAAIVRAQNKFFLTFDPNNDIIDMPGGAKKFTIRYDAASDKYWSVTSIVNDDNYDPNRKPEHIRNTMALISSDDLTQWTVEKIIVQNLSDVTKIGFQYMDWQFDGSHIVIASRTAYPDGLGGANTFHDSNFLTFHRITTLDGDIDGDGFVGINDLNIILSNWNQNVPVANILFGDLAGIGDGFVGISDLNIVLGNWNAGTPPALDTSTIPEPATLGLVALGGLVLIRRRGIH